MEKENTRLQIIKSKMRGPTESVTNMSRSIIKQLADQLITVFIVGILCLWLAALRSEVDVPAERAVWWHSMILSVFALLLWLFWGRKRIHRPLRRWVLLCAMVGFVWLAYLIRGISLPSAVFMGFAIVLLICAVFLLLALVLAMTRWGVRGKLDKVITKVVRWGHYSFWVLVPIVIMASVVQGLKALWDTGMTGWWMTPLLYLSVLILIVVSLAYVLSIDSGGET